MDEGHIVVDSIEPITLKKVTSDLARESGFESRKALLENAKHGPGDQVYLIRFHYRPAGGCGARHHPLVTHQVVMDRMP